MSWNISKEEDRFGNTWTPELREGAPTCDMLMPVSITIYEKKVFNLKWQFSICGCFLICHIRAEKPGLNDRIRDHVLSGVVRTIKSQKVPKSDFHGTFTLYLITGAIATEINGHCRTLHGPSLCGTLLTNLANLNAKN